jgi:tetratricopeptide (TPR) repeat protein
MTPTVASHLFAGDLIPDFDEAMKVAVETQNVTVKAVLLLHSMIISNFFQDFKSAEKSANLLSKCPIDSFTCFTRSRYWLHEGLIALSLAHVNKRRRIRWAKRSLRSLAKLATYSWSNFGNKVLLLEAEVAFQSGSFHIALQKYEESISLSREQLLWCDVALACERASASLACKDRVAEAEKYLQDAIAAYTKWGALAKVHDIERRIALRNLTK